MTERELVYLFEREESQGEILIDIILDHGFSSFLRETHLVILY